MGRISCERYFGGSGRFDGERAERAAAGGAIGNHERPWISRSLVIADRSPHRPLALRASATIEPSLAPLLRFEIRDLDGLSLCLCLSLSPSEPSHPSPLCNKP